MAFFVPAVNAAVIGYRTAVVPDRLTGRVGGIARTIALCLGSVRAAHGRPAAALVLRPRDRRIYAALMLLLAVLGDVNPSIRNAPSLSDLDDLPRGRSRPRLRSRLTAQAASASPFALDLERRTGALAERRTRRLLATSAPIVSAAPPSSTAPGR